jgi:cytosine/uracil/thiamine/allantoin permease
VLTGTIGARIRVPFTILARSSFGFWFSYFSVISLIVLSMFWFGIQTYIGSECVYQVRRLLSHLLPRTQLLFIQILKAIWPSIAHLPNHLPANANITTSGMFRLPFTVSATFICPQESFAILSIGPFSFLSCSSLPRNYDISSWQSQS